MGLIGWFRRVWQAVTRRRQASAPIRRRVLGFEPLEARETPATFYYLLAGFNAPVGASGMTFLGRELEADPTLAGHVTVIDWQRTGLLFDRPVLPAAQKEYVTTRIRDDLVNHGAGAGDDVVLIGHSFGGFLAQQLASKVPGINRPARSLITIDPIDWNRALALKPLLNQSRLWHNRPAGVPPGNVINFVQRSSLLQGYSIRGAINNPVLAKGDDDLWSTPDDGMHYLIDSDVGADNNRLGVYATIKSALCEVFAGISSPIHARTALPAPQTLWSAIRQVYKFVPAAQLYRFDPTPENYPELFASQGRSLVMTLAPSTRGIIVNPFRRSMVESEIQISGRVLGWGEAALGQALWRTLKDHAAELGIERLQWSGRIWSNDRPAELTYRGSYASNRFFVGFSLEGAKSSDPAALTRFMQDLRTAWSEEMQLHAGWPVLAVKSLGDYIEPWQIQPLIRPESDPANPSRLGRFVAKANIGDEETFHGTQFALAFFPARDRAEVEASLYEGSTMWILPVELIKPDWRPWRSFVTRSNPNHRL